ncbi:uncharacterized protein V6R79_009494 [Siganus canaliculatus]
MVIMSATWKQRFLQILLILISCRHINTKTPASTEPPLAPVAPLLQDVRSVVLEGESHSEKVELLNPVNLTLECIWTGSRNKSPNITALWTKDGKVLESKRSTVELKNEQYTLRSVFTIVSEESLGNYTCVFENEAKIDFILTAPQISESQDKIISYVGDTVAIACKLDKTKPKPSTWNWYRANSTDKEQIVPSAETHRYKIKNEENKTKLLIHNLTEADAGLYYCGAVYPLNTTLAHVELKVITIFEPLKPFIAIMIEVIILVAVILLYEKSQSKKSPTTGYEINDQMNTLAQGDNSESEGNSSIRQRKV